MCLAVPGKIIKIDDIHGIVDIMGIKKQINIQLLENPKLGACVLIHAGFAIKQIHDEEFNFLNHTLKEMLGEDIQNDD